MPHAHFQARGLNKKRQLHRQTEKKTMQYCSVKDFQLGIWFGEKVKG
ncbi:hypothetical protein FDUTEX481_08618 [Tolypothrix sp. PCC 7601]|nr:hypothetical protein FDUTEX481_08618 [Tolypothrix sp. PCC 7601]